MEEFGSDWITRGLDQESSNLIASSDDLIIRTPSQEIERYGYRGEAGNVDPLRDGSDFLPALEQAKSFLKGQGIAISAETALSTPKCVESYVGDDEIGISNNPFYQSLKLAIYPILGMQVSAHDTSINPHYGNYAEDLILTPATYYNTYACTHKTGNTEDMSFIDIPKLRLLMPVSPMRLDHSGTVDGKSSMMGSRVGWTPKRSPFRMLNELASLAQDSLLGLHRSKKPAYMPTQLGGLGKAYAFGNPVNFRNYFLAWKQGERFEFTNHVIYLLDRFALGYNSELEQRVDPLLSNLVRFNTQFHDWIKSRSIYAPQFWLERPDWATEYIVDHMGHSRVTDSALGRAVKEGVLVTEDQLLVHVEHARQCDALLSQNTWEEFIEAKNSIVQEWKSLSVYGQASLGLIQEIRPLWKRGSHEFDPERIERVFSFLSRRGKDLKNLISKQPVYRAEVIDRLYDRSVMRVKTTLTPTKWASESTFVVERDVLSARNITRLRDLVNWILLPKEDRGPPPRESIDDDEVIIESLDQDMVCCIITDDIKLCKRVNGKTGLPVFRVPVWWYHKDIYYGEMETPWVGLLEQLVPDKVINYIEDTGSIEAFEESHYLDGVASVDLIRSKIHPLADVSKGIIPFSKVVIKNNLESQGIPGMYPRGYTYDSRNYLRLSNRVRKGKELDSGS